MPQENKKPIICLFNHKGGVSKTTTTFNLGWALADRGKKILIVDTDPQCNLTGTVLGLDDDANFTNFYNNNTNANVSDCLQPVFQGSATPLAPANVVATGNPNLFLLAGKLDLAEYETQISVALSTSPAIPALQNIPGALPALLRLTAAHHDFDAVLVDMSPSVGALNHCLLMGSDFFIVPTSPDYYCNQAISSLARVIPRWNLSITPFRNPALLYSFPNDPPKFCGIISQRYRPRSGAPAKSFQSWIDVIKQSVNDILIPALQAHNMAVSEADFLAATPGDTPFNLINISDFNSLIAKSQDYNVPIFALTADQIDQVGNVLENMEDSRDRFLVSFNNLANSVEVLTGI